MFGNETDAADNILSTTFANVAMLMESRQHTIIDFEFGEDADSVVASALVIQVSLLTPDDFRASYASCPDFAP